MHARQMHGNPSCMQWCEAMNTQPINRGLAGSEVSPVSGLLLSIPDAGNFLGLTTWQVRALIADRKVPVVRVGRKFYLRRAALVKWAEGAEKWRR
jgi:excisionase family DNA binding protein